MSDSEKNPGTDREDLKAEVASLRLTLNIILVLLLGVSLLLNAFIFRGIRSVRAEAKYFPPNLSALFEQFNQKDLPRLQRLVADLQEYNKTHPEMGPLLMKHNIAQPVATAQPGGVAPPLPPR